MKKNAIVTGASRGIGNAIAKMLLQNDYRVIGTSTTGNITTIKHEEFRSLSLDLGSAESIKKATESIKEMSSSVNLLINNGAVLGNADDILNNPENARKVIEIDLIGGIDFTTRLLPLFTKGGSIISVSSGAGSIESIEYYNMGAYNIAKAGINMYTVSLAQKLKDKNIKVSCIDPGWVATAMGGKDATRRPEDVAIDLENMLVNGFESGKWYFQGKKRDW